MKNKTINEFVAIFCDSIRNLYISLMTEKIVHYLTINNITACTFCKFEQSFSINDINKCKKIGIKKIISFLEISDDVINYAHDNGIKIFIIGRKLSNANCSCVYNNDFKGGYLAAKYLIKNGAKEFTYVGFKNNECSVRRLEGFKKKISEEFSDAQVKVLYDYQLKRNVFNEILGDHKGVFIYCDELLLNFVAALKRSNFIFAPNMLIGFDGISRFFEGISSYLSISFDYENIALAVVNMVIGKDTSNEKEFDVFMHEV